MPINTNMLLQMILGGGSALSQGKDWTAPVAGVGMDTLQSQNMWNAIMGGGAGGNKNNFMFEIMKKLMGEGVTDSSIKFDDKGAKLDLSPKMVSEYFGGGDTGKMGEGFKGNPAEFGNFTPENYSLGANAPNVQAPEAPTNLPTGPGVMDVIKAFGNPSVSQQGNQMPNLAGLKPSDVANALNVQTGMRSQTVKEAMQPVEMLYREALTQQALASAKNLNIPKDQRTAAIQNYEYAVGGGYTGSFAEFVSNKGGEATSIEEWKQARSGGYEGTYYDWKKEMTALGGGLSLDEKVQQKVAISSVKRREQLADPIAISKRIDDIVKNDSNLRAKILTGTPEESQKAKASAKMNAIKQIIEEGSGGGKIIDATRSGSIITIKVKWEDGTVEEMKYDIAK